MSFILQRVISGSKISPSDTSIQTRNDLFGFQKPTIVSAKELSEIESKTMVKVHRYRYSRLSSAFAILS